MTERNWAGTHAYAAARIEPASTIEDVRRLVKAGGPVHALGTRHSFTDLPDTEGTLIDVAGIEPGFALTDDGAVTVGAGTRYGVLAGWLEERGRALHNLGSLPHISVGGATATGTHGSGDTNGVLTTAVRGIRYVGADGDVHDVRRDDLDFRALAVGVGAFGVTVALSLETQPTFRVRQDVYEGLSWDAFLSDLGAVTGAGYSVSVFTTWDDLGFVWVKSRLETDASPVADTLLDGLRIPTGAQPLGPDAVESLTQLDGVPGPWLHRLPHFRLDRQPSWGDEIQSEYFVDRADAPAALEAVRRLGDRIRPHLFVSELRTMAADDLFLSPASGRDSLAVHFTWHNDAEGVGAVLPAVEEALEPFAARPHWGKRHGFDRARLEAVHPRLADARAVFERLDPDGRFVNAHLRRVGLRE